MSQGPPFSEFEYLSDEQLHEAEAELTNDDWLTTMRFLDLKIQYIRELALI